MERSPAAPVAPGPRPMGRPWIFALLGGVLALAFATNLLAGAVPIPLAGVLGVLTGHPQGELWETIVMDIRLPKAITAVLAGIALSVSGLQMQTVFRNPLAGPYVLGVSSGAGLGVAILLMGAGALGLGSPSALGLGLGITGAAWLGAALVLLLILAVSTRIRDIMTILILGMMFGAAASAAITILQLFSPESMLRAYVVWTMGSLSAVTGSNLIVFGVAVGVGLALSLAALRVMNILLLGDAYCHTLGLNLTWARALVFASTSLLAGAVTAFCGPIGFIGIAMPHVARMVFRTANHAVLMPGVILLGASVMLICDTLAQVPGNGLILPLNAVTALMGVPIVVYVVIRSRRFEGM